jgi:hypothetical protein
MRAQTAKPTSLVYKREGSIITLVYPKDITVDLDLARHLVVERLKYYAGKSYPTLADVRMAKLFTSEARDFLAKGDAIKGIPALAILVGNYFSVLMANLFMRFSKPEIPTKVFRTKEQAVKWLNEFALKH